MKIFHQMIVSLILVSAVSATPLMAASGKRTSRNSNQQPVLASINLLDRNGFSETIRNDDRLSKYKSVDFLKAQPYQKVLRIFKRDQRGDIRAYITSYHPNGNVKQYLEVVNNRALGRYCEWYSNGSMKIDAMVIGGEADIHMAAEKSWLFDNYSHVWDEDGHMIAQINYSHGELEGWSAYYYPNGNLWKRMPYHKNQIEGTLEIFQESGVLLQSAEYRNGVLEGTSKRYWNADQVAAEETYCKGLLATANYFDQQGNSLGMIREGSGSRILFNKKGAVCEIQEYQEGRQEGEVRILGDQGELVSHYRLKDGAKHGEDIEYYPVNPLKPDKLQPKLVLNWSQGKMMGLVKTWYPNGAVESQREMSNNVKNGLLMAWYTDGNLMMMEEYDHDKLVRGEYFMRGEKTPVSIVHNGEGTVTLVDANGNLLRKVQYCHGAPVSD